MKKQLILIVIFFMNLTVFGQTQGEKAPIGKITDYKGHDDNGKLIAEGRIDEDYHKYGKWIYYYDTGKVSQEETYKNWLCVGEKKRYFKNGNLKEYLLFDDNGNLKKCKRYYSNGQLRLESATDGQLDDWNPYFDGTVLMYHENGALMMMGQMEDKQCKGDWVYYNEDGSIKETIDKTGEYFYDD